MISDIIRGRGSICRIPDAVTKLHMHRPLIVSQEPLLSMLLDRVPELKAYPVFTAFHPNPDLTDCAAGKQIFLQNGCDGFISAGGGSSMDTAKGIKAMLLGETCENVMANCLEKTDCYPVIAIPGTAGTGAEATQFAVVYHEGRKVSLNHPALQADAVILDGALLATLPSYHRKSCGMDALSQGIESYWSAGATPESRIHAEKAIRGVTAYLQAYLQNDPEAAQCMLEASFESGRGIQISKTTAAHAMSYQLTKMLGYAHGHACMLTLPEIWQNMLTHPEMLPVLEQIAGMMGLEHAAEGPEHLRKYMLDPEMKPEAILDENMLETLAASVNAERLGNHPVKLDHAALKEIYRNAFAALIRTDD